MSVACTSSEGRSTGSMREVAGSASTEGRRPTRMLEVTVSSPEDRSTTIVHSTVLSRQSLAGVLWSLVSSWSSLVRRLSVLPQSLLPRTAQQLEADPLSRFPHRSTARVLSSNPRVPTTLAVSSPEDRSTVGNRPSVTVYFSEDRCLSRPSHRRSSRLRGSRCRGYDSSGRSGSGLLRSAWISNR